MLLIENFIKKFSDKKSCKLQKIDHLKSGSDVNKKEEPSHAKRACHYFIQMHALPTVALPYSFMLITIIFIKHYICVFNITLYIRLVYVSVLYVHLYRQEQKKSKNATSGRVITHQFFLLCFIWFYSFLYFY